MRTVFREWCFPVILRGHTEFSGRFIVICAPVRISRVFGHEEMGMELYRWSER